MLAVVQTAAEFGVYAGASWFSSSVCSGGGGGREAANWFKR